MVTLYYCRKDANINLPIVLHALFASVAISCDAFTSAGVRTPGWSGEHCEDYFPSKIFNAAVDDVCVDGGMHIVRTITTRYETNLASDQCGEHRSRKLSWRLRMLRKDVVPKAAKRYSFTYDYNVMVIGSCISKQATTGIMLIHPIGVGIGKWYYDRLLESLHDRYGDVGRRSVFLVPDLLGSATASGPTDEIGRPISDLPLLNVTDWTRQISHLMAEYEAKSEAEEGHSVGSWIVVANGGCSPMALQVAAESSSTTAPFKAKVTNVIISSPPRLSFFLDAADPDEVRKSYRTLSGIAGRLFWWYSLRRDGRFVRKFSERNLVGNTADLGDEWTPNCLRAAMLHDGRSRFSTFAFLAGALRDGCLDSLNAMRGCDVSIDFIRGTDKRRNRARSWFWTRKKRAGSKSDDDKGGVDANRNDATLMEGSIQQYVRNNGNGGLELFVGGRISLAWEDPNGYSKRLMGLLSE